MKKFTVSALVTISLHTVVEADNEEEAIKIAEDRQLCSLMDCDRMGESVEEVWFHSGELDGIPHEIKVDNL